MGLLNMPSRLEAAHLWPLLLATVLACACLPVQAEPLSRVVERVLEQHPDIRTSQALLNAAGERVRQARSNFYPRVGMDAALAEGQDAQFDIPLDRSTRRSDLFLRWNLFRGLADRHSVRMAEQDSLAAQADVADAHENVTLQVTVAYVEVLRLRQRLALAEAYVAEARRLGEEVDKRVRAGKSPAADRAQTRMSQVEANLQLAQLRGELEGAEQRYQLLTGAKASDLADPGFDTAVPELNVDALMDQVLAENRRVRAALARAAARAEEVGVAGGALFPSLDLELRKRLLTDIDPAPSTETRSYSQVVLNYEVPLGGSTYSRKREAVARKEAALAAADSALLQARTNLGQLWSIWREAVRIAPELGERAAASEQVVAAYDLQFNAGRRSLQDLISIRAERHRARAEVIDNRNEQLQGAAQILNLLGRLRSTLAGEAPAPRPTAQADTPPVPPRLASLELPIVPCQVCGAQASAGEVGP